MTDDIKSSGRGSFRNIAAFKPSLQIGLGLALTIVIFGLALGLAALLERIAEREVTRIASQNLENISKQMAREISAGMNRFAREVENEATLSVLRNPSATADDLRPVLDKFVRRYPEFAFVGIIDVPTAKVVAANGGLFEGGSAKNRPAFENAREKLFLGDVHPAVRLAELLPKLPNGDLLRFLDVGVPVFDERGQLIRVLATHVSFEWTRQVREQILAPIKDLRGVEAMLVDTTGKIVLPPGNDIKVGQPVAALTSMDQSGVTRLQPWSNSGSFLTTSAMVMPEGAFDGFGWRVVVRQPEAIALAPAVRLRNSYFIGAALLACVAAMLGWLIANRATLPVRKLALLAEQLERNDGDRKLDPSSIEEIERIQNALSRLSRDKQRHNSEMDERKRRFSLFADTLPHLVFETDAEGRLEYLNSQWVSQFGHVEGMRFADLSGRVLADDRRALFDTWEQARRNGTAVDLLARFLVDGASGAEWFRVRVLPIMDGDGKVTRLIGTLTNVQQTMKSAEDMQDALAREQAARAELERTNAMKDDFLATLSHELRTPLNVVGGWAQMLELRNDDAAYVVKGARIIQKNINLQADMISRLLDMSAIAAGKFALQLQPLDVGQLLAGARESFTRMAEDKGVVLHVDLPEHRMLIQADPRCMDQILSNLLSNSIKFTDKGDEIRVRAMEVSGSMRLEVRDSGCGIAKEFLPYVFERFRQQDSSITRKQGGVGLGLAIVKSLVDLQGASIRVHSEGSGKGCIFTLDFPCIQDETAQAQLSAGHAVRDLELARCDGMRVMLVEDDAHAREVTRDALLTLGAKVTCAEDAISAWEALTNGDFDLLVCDIGLPGMNGYQLMQQIRLSGNFRIADLPAIALTAYAMTHDEHQALEAGFHRHVSKPFKLLSLSVAVREVLGLPDLAQNA
jgi:signal transduction histidine kinase/ActR/RegA family two-component response regulator